MDDLVQQGIAALRAGDRRTAHQRLTKAVEAYPDDAEAWCWLADAVESPIERRFCLERMVALGGDDPNLHRELAHMGPSPRPVPTPAQIINAAKRIGSTQPERRAARASWLHSF